MTVDLQKARQKWFQALKPLRAEKIVGLRRGVGIPSDHPLDGVLENLHWFGKRFHADLRADAFLFLWRPGRDQSGLPSNRDGDPLRVVRAHGNC